MKVKYYIGIISLLWISPGIPEPLLNDIQQNAIVQLMESAVASSSSIAIAKADISRAESTATMLRAGPYEFEAAASHGRREVSELSDKQHYKEWSAGLSRTLRLPGKRKIDQKLARIEFQIANAAYENVLIDQRLAFIEQWITWSTAFQLVDVARKQAEEATRLADYEQIQVEKGAGRQVNADLLRAEAELAMLQAEQEEFAMITAEMILKANFPDIKIPIHISAIAFSSTDIESLLSADYGKSPKQRLAELAWEKAKLTAKRARQNRVPDPTVGLEFTDEFGGQESAIKAQISIPIGGITRRASSRLAYEQMNITTLELDLVNRLASKQRLIMEKKVRLALTNRVRTNEASMFSMSALERFEEGYEKGAVTISDLISAHRSHYVIEQVRIEQEGKSAQAFLNLLAMYLSTSEI